MKEKKLWIFDFDGVLVFSVEITFKCIIEAAKEVDVPLPSFNILKESWGKNFHDDLFPNLAEKLNWSHLEMENVLENFLRKNEELVYPMPSSIFTFLKKASHRKDLAILTNRSLESLIACAYKYSIDLTLFKIIICAQDSLYKPNPKIFEPFWQVNYKPNEVIFIGDSIVFDLGTAKNHQPEIDFIAISSGLHEENEFLKAGVLKEFILSNPVEMEKWL